MADMAQSSLALVVLAITLAIGALILAQVQTQVESLGNNSVAWESTQSGLDAVNTFGGFLPVVAIVVVGALVIGLLAFRGGGF